ncbi:MAG: Eco57I restriction-modification methylase domain-containing protein, partial [Fusobacteriaceae bacterium]
MHKFNSTFNYKLIYIFSINSETHKGLLKVGDTTLSSEELISDFSIDNLKPNSTILNKAANKRIKQYTNTAGIKYNLLHTELAIITEIDKKGKEIPKKAFRDFDVHRVLIRSGVKTKKISETTGKEWFKISLEKVLSAINAVKKGQQYLPNIDSKNDWIPIVFRPEQEDAINKTVKQFKKKDKMLWNAKMRFGKTLCSLEVIRKMEFKKTIILTHRPVVNEGWYEDFKNIFGNDNNYSYASKTKGDSLKNLINTENKIIYFASVQDLRGSDKVGGKFSKNDIIFDINWDLVVVDEAHEGTTTALGEAVIKEIIKESNKNSTKFLALSGTPFNIVNEYEQDELYTWDYVMEQNQKRKYEISEEEINHFGDSNPYGGLPTLNIYTYNLGTSLQNKTYVDIEDKAFNFKEFFRTWTGDLNKDLQVIPTGQNIGDFCHEKDIESFLNLITKDDENSHYPYSNEEYRDLFKHSLWMVPGVREASGLKRLMEKHHIFGNGQFNIINVAGDGDEEDETKEALEKVKSGIAKASKVGEYTITLSCGKLTTGVTIPEWTAVMMLSGSYSTSAANYLQTIFRVQSPANIDGKIKEQCYVFDFAPDRTLKMVADAVSLSTKAGNTSSDDRSSLGEFLNFCPVISINGTKMQEYNVDGLLQQLKKVYAERAVKNGFDDNNLYNNIELAKLTDGDLEIFSELEKIIKSTNQTEHTSRIDINSTGLTNEERKEKSKLEKKPKKELSEEDKRRLEEIKEKQSNRAKAISTLRAISIRIPLLIYGAEISLDKDISVETLLDDKIIDAASWEEFMPKGITKDIFKTFIKYYDVDVFIAAGRTIRESVKSADFLPPKERIQKIVNILSNFKNPDKETVLTPWRVVNRHMGDCLGGYNFYNEAYSEIIEEPRFIDKESITKETLNKLDTKILEINSKTGLYPLYITYSIFKQKCEKEQILTKEKKEILWKETIENNIFVLCKTQMAKAITKRTLSGYKNIKINSHYFEDLINQMKNKQEQFVDKISKFSYWKKGEHGEMKFDAIVGNPPYQESDGGAQASASPIYQYFVQNSKKLNPNYLSFIMPTRWYAGGKGLDSFRDEMLNDINLRELNDCVSPEDIFPNTNIRGGVCYFLWDKNFDNKENLVRVITHEKGKVIADLKRSLKIDGTDIFIRDAKAITILNKVFPNNNVEILSDYISSRKPFGLEGAFVKDEKFNSKKDNMKKPVICYGKAKTFGYVENEYIILNKNWIDKWKVYMPYANNIGT